MNRARTIFAAAIILAALSLGRTTTSAQEVATEPVGFRFGLFGGANYNYLDAPMQRFIAIGTDATVTSRDYSGGTAFSPFGGLMGEYLFNDRIGTSLRASYDARDITKSVDDSELTARLAYVSVEAAFRLNIASGFHVNVGPSLSIPVVKSYDYTPATGEATSAVDNADLQNVPDVSYGAWGGFAYDIPLNSRGGTRWFLTPFVEGSWMYNQKDLDVAQAGFDTKWSTMTARAGVQIKFGAGATSPETAPPATELNVRVRTPLFGVLQPQEIVDHLPLVGYIFFDQNTVEIPARYAKLSPADAKRFDETRVAEPIGTGPKHDEQIEEKQMRTYYQALNIMGGRLAKYGDAKITLVGSAPDQKDALAMAEAVKAYLVNAFAISSERIATKGQRLPPHASGTRATPKEDLPLVAEENRRVEMLTDDQRLLQPVQLHSAKKEPIANDIYFRVGAPYGVQSWSMKIRGEHFYKSYGPFSMPSVRMSATPILDKEAEGTYTATIEATLGNGEVVTKETIFKLKKTELPPAMTDRYSILFDYDESMTVELYEEFLRTVVAPALPNGSAVFVHGHTDKIGDAEYNDELSIRRAESTMKILADEVRMLGLDVTFDAIGYGEVLGDFPFANGTPEGRHYNRTVIIDIIPNRGPAPHSHH